MAVGNIQVILDLDENGYLRSARRVGTANKQMGDSLNRLERPLNRIDRGVNGIIPRLRDFFVTISIARAGISNLVRSLTGFQKTILATNANIERMTFLLRGLSNATSTAGQIAQANHELGFLLDTVETAPFTLNAATNSFVKFKTVGLDPLNGGFRSLLDGVAAFGGTDDTLARATIAIQQSVGKTVISMEELRQQLGEAVPSAIALLARSANLTIGELVEHIESGRLEARTAINLLTDEFGRAFAGSAERLTQAFSGQLNVLRSRFTRFQLEIGRSTFFETVQNELQEFLLFFDEGVYSQIGESIGRALGQTIVIFSEFVQFIYRNREAIVNLTRSVVILVAAYKTFTILRTVSSTLAKLTLAFEGLVVTQRAYANSLVATGAAAQGTAAAITRSRVAAIGFSRAVTAVGGPLGIAVTAISLAATAFATFGQNANRAFDALERGQQILDEQQRDSIRKKIDALKEQAAAASDAFISARDVPDADDRDRIRAQNVKNITDEVFALENNLVRNLVSLDQREARRRIRDTEDAARDRLAIIATSYQDENLKLDELRTNGEISEEESLKERIELIEDFSERRRKSIEVSLTEVRGLINKATEEGENNQRDFFIQKQIELNNALLKNASDTERQINNARAGIRLIEPTDDDDTLDKLGNALAQITVKGRELRAELAGAGGDVEKFTAQLEEGVFGDEGTALLANQKKLKSILDQIQANEDLTKAIADQKEEARKAEAAQERLGELYTEIRADIENLGSALDNDGIAQDNFVIRVMTQAQELATDLGLTKEAADALIATLSGLAQTASSLSFSNDLREETKDINLGLLNERDRLQAEFDRDIKNIQDRARVEELSGQDRVRVEEQVNAAILARTEKFVRDTEAPILTLSRQWAEAGERIQEAQAGWLDDFSQRLTDFVTTGKFVFTDFAESIIADIIKIQIQAALAQSILSAFGGNGTPGLFNNLFNSSSSASIDTATRDNLFNSNAFADGGIMTSQGALQLRKYASGGIASTPQLALYGEGSRPEAFVPLPDGRSIPVSIEGQQQSNVTVNLINQSGEKLDAEASNQRFDGREMILDVVLKSMTQPGSFRNGMRDAVR